MSETAQTSPWIVASVSYTKQGDEVCLAVRSSGRDKHTESPKNTGHSREFMLVSASQRIILQTAPGL